MLFDSKKPPADDDGLAPEPVDGSSEIVASVQADRLRAWRESAQRVARAWKACLAAEPRESASLYGFYFTALEDEQHAAVSLAEAFQTPEREPSR